MSWSERWFLLIMVELLTSLKSPLYSTHWVMVNNSTNINKNHLLPQFIEWWSTIPLISTKVEVRGDVCWYWWNCWPSFNELKCDVIFVDIGGIVDHHSMSWSERWFLLILVELLTITQWVEVRGDFCWYGWNCWPSLNLSPQYIEWWSTIPPISTKITSHLNSLSDSQQFHITQWVEVRGDFCWYWWNCWPSLNELRWEVIFVDMGGIVDHHSMNKSPLTSTHWVMVNNSTNINKNHLSLQLIEWWSTIPPISTKITSHLSMSWS
jgi:hypothetical protein